MKSHPAGFYVLWFTEMWERLSFYLGARRSQEPRPRRGARLQLLRGERKAA